MSKPNNFVWYELMTTDTKAAESFYANVIGWNIQDSGMSDRSYAILSAGEIPIGGLMPIPPAAGGARPCWSGYVAVDDVDAFAKKVSQGGGAIHHAPEDIPGVGRFAVVADPYGAAFILFKNSAGAEPAPVVPGTPGHIGWRELYAGDLEKCFAFYSGLFGWTKAEAMDMGPMGTYQTLAAGSESVGGMMKKPAEVPASFWLYYFNVDDIQSAIARVTANHGKVLLGPQEVPGGIWIVQGMDPQGAIFALVGPQP